VADCAGCHLEPEQWSGWQSRRWRSFRAKPPSSRAGTLVRVLPGAGAGSATAPMRDAQTSRRHRGTFTAKDTSRSPRSHFAINSAAAGVICRGQGRAGNVDWRRLAAQGIRLWLLQWWSARARAGVAATPGGLRRGDLAAGPALRPRFQHTTLPLPRKRSSVSCAYEPRLI